MLRIVRENLGPFLALSISLCAMTDASLSADRVPHNQEALPGPPLTPAEAVKKMKVPKGFSVEVVAAEPDVVNPVAMCIDEKGRFWITESFEYPRREPGPGRDRIKVLEDTDQDGKVDKVTIFAEGLNIPSGIAVGHGGVWIANSPDILFMQDTDGDLKADKSEVVVTGFGRTDTHELPNSFTWGPDGWLYGLNGVFNYSDVKYGEKNPNYRSDHPGWKFTCAMFRIDPRTREFQVFAEGTSNPWGIAINDDGEFFISACVIDHLWHIVEGAYYIRQGGPYPPHTWPMESIVKHKHQKAAYCGITWFDSDAYPEEYRGVLYMGNIHGNCINADKAFRKGSSYEAVPREDILSANDVWFMPVVQKTGPDGCLYILDWYDRYHCYQDANADPEGIDRGKGRLYRLRYQDTPRAPRFDLAKETDEQLIQRLGSPNVFFREQAQRILGERARPDTAEKLHQLALDSTQNTNVRLGALFAWAVMGNRDALSQTLIQDHSAGLLQSPIRGWGIRLILASQFGRDISQSFLSAQSETDLHTFLSQETDPFVTRQLVTGIAKFKDPVATTMLLDRFAAAGNDRLLMHLCWQHLAPRIGADPGTFLQKLRSHHESGFADLEELLPRAIERLLDSEQDHMKSVVELIHMSNVGPNTRPQLTAACLEEVTDRLINGQLKPAQISQLKSALEPNLQKAMTARLRSDVPPKESAAFLDQAELMLCCLGNELAAQNGAILVGNPKLSVDDRIRWFRALTVGKPQACLKLASQILESESANADLTIRLLGELGRLSNAEVGQIVLSSLDRFPDAVRPRAFELLTTRPVWSKPLLAAIEAKKLSKDVLNLNQLRRLQNFADPEIKQAVKNHWGVIRESRDYRRDQAIADIRRLLAVTKGDPINGQKVFVKVCGQCHKIYGEGAEVGPDVTSNGRNSFDQLLQNVLDPSLVVGNAYQARTLLTTDGRVLTGLPVEETPQRVVLKVQGGKQEIIPRSDIEEYKVSELSMMPDQLEKQLTSQEMADLFEFLVLDKPPGDPAAKRLAGAPKPD